MTAAAIGVTLALAVSGCAPASSSDVVIRIAMGASGDAVDSNFDTLKTQYETKYPDRTVEIIVQEDDVYQTTGLSTLLSSREAPDAYFEWSGPRMRNHVADGDGADISEYLSGDAFDGRFDDGAFTGMDVDGSGIYMVPWTGDVTDIVWYNKTIFSDLGLDVPTTWDEFMDVCAAIKASGVTPIVEGNKDQWTVGNWASHIASRVVGEDVYAETMNGEAPMNSPEMVDAMGYLAEIAREGYINDSVNALPDDEANTQFFLGRAAMIVIGSWLMADAQTDGEGLEFDYFNTPALDGAGDQESVLGISTGFMVNAKSAHIAETMDFLELVASAEGTKLWAQAGLAPMTIDPFDGVDADERTVSLATLMSTAPTVVAPSDSGYDIEVAAAFYDAVANIIGGGNVQDALDTAEKRIAEIR
ncbi:extracellular solute-binding protein [Salinibacterium sp. G-O1]|uniref:ABC transporter substrate-binding protein n=1 Tax=Salinibacterium sp. G-O1 TaxID=3046208 RepID=UPI0024B99B14|nr:extracellular solute-binding protein [Salinibacterium sp. G-O1]MDJ0335259.1 extracellular solute-binding protein [Salinibacterium sp. G-O1]